MTAAKPLLTEYERERKLAAINARAPRQHPAGPWAAAAPAEDGIPIVVARYRRRGDARLAIRLEDERRHVVAEEPCGWKVLRVSSVSGRTPVRRLDELAARVAAPVTMTSSIEEQLESVTASAAAGVEHLGAIVRRSLPSPALAIVRKSTEPPAEERRLFWSREWVRIVLVGRTVVVERCRRDALGGDSWSPVDDVEQRAEILARAIVDMADQQRGGRG